FQHDVETRDVSCGPHDRSTAEGQEWRTMTSRLPRHRGETLLPAVLSTTAGAVDAIGFLALGGLFTAHITGNVVVLAAHYVVGGFGQIGPLLAVPVFMVVMGVVTLASGAIARAGSPPLRQLLWLH